MTPRGACDSCRQRKIKCDRSSPICSPCRLSGLLCTYCMSRRKRGPKPKSRSIQAVTPERGPRLPTSHDREPRGISNSPCDAAPIHEISPETQPGGIINPSPLAVCHRDLVSYCAREGYTPEQSVERCIDLYMQFVFPLLPIICESTLRSQATLNLPSFTDGILSPLSALTPDMIAAIRTYSLTASLCAVVAHVRPCEVYPEHDTIGSLFLASSQAMLQPYAGYDISYPTSASLSIRIFQASCYQMMGNSCLAWHTIDEATRLAQQMRLHDEHSYDGLDPVEAKLRRNAFWFLYSADRSNSVLKGRKQALGEFNLPGSLTTTFSPDDCPQLLDQVRPENGGHFEENLMTGFQRHRDVWRLGFSVLFDLDLFLATSSRTTGDTGLNDTQMRSLTESYLDFSSVLDDLPEFLQSPAIICETDNGREKHQRRAFWIQRANITLSYHYLRMAILNRFLSANLLGVLGLNDGQTAIDLRKIEIAHELLILIASVPLDALKANGEPFAEKLRYVCATLLEVTQRHEPSQLLARAKKHFTALPVGSCGSSDPGEPT
ncbi:Zn(2)-C6 fungal-type domain-containing protein [Fusarium keratoplasticum]|uniref:Zn(2)-C6 fungal-type domain-containing protein n=1 Tax=Fusarium keratoplasticum TaxID=1328300 RepID=A0ACC0QHI0_9HYPO|nr:Zn(2)-C6 fungal-type domain-containing protein [Fusarium keratoplasticum]KAI8654438.1 Zn(2)-C6 fungal-type domain-containing protein [Fusarium keratoplasticum]